MAAKDLKLAYSQGYWALLTLANPWILHGEDPTWGQSAAGQLQIHTAIHNMAEGIRDPAAKKAIQTAAAAGMNTAVQAITRPK